MVSPKSFQHFFAQVNGIRMHYVAEGNGPVVVLCHGWPDMWLGWRHQIKAIAQQGYKVVAPDLRGFGQTDAPKDAHQYGTKTLTNDLAALLDHLKVEQAVFIGHDWGGALVWRMALFHPSRVRAVGAICTAYIPRSSTFWSVNQTAELIPQFYYQVYFNSDEAEKELDDNVELLYRVVHRSSVKGDRAPAGSFMGSKTSLLGLAPRDIPRSKMLEQEELDYYVEHHRQRGSLGGLNWYRNHRVSWEEEANLPRRIDAPALMITAGKDPVLTPSMTSKMEQDIPNLSRGHVEEGAHFVQAECPKQVNEILIDWLKKVVPVNTSRL